MNDTVTLIESLGLTPNNVRHFKLGTELKYLAQKGELVAIWIEGQGRVCRGCTVIYGGQAYEIDRCFGDFPEISGLMFLTTCGEIIGPNVELC